MPGFTCGGCDDCRDEMQECIDAGSECGIDDMLAIVEDVLAECY
jgi:hypothetical protein